MIEVRIPSLTEYVTAQWGRLCELTGVGNLATTIPALTELLGPAGFRPRTSPPRWPSYVADDHTPVEFSLAFDADGTHTMRLLAETVADEAPGTRANQRAALRFLDQLAKKFPLALNRFRAVADLFLPDDPQGLFALWYSFVVRAGQQPRFKLYLNPSVRGPERAPELVADGLRRLGLAGAYQVILDHAVKRATDTFIYFALDLHDAAHARVKVYLAHAAAEATVATEAARAVPGLDPAPVERFCTVLGGGSRFTARPLASAYTFVEGDTDRPSTYTVYMPIRDYVGDDQQARDRIAEYLPELGLDPAVLDRALAALTDRALGAGVGLIPHVSLRLAAERRPEPTVYLSSEAFGVQPCRSVLLV